MQKRKLHIGPGTVYIPGWINVDVFSNVKADIYSSALALPYKGESFDLIYASHVLEHFPRYFILSALGHWRALLKSGGILRLSVPNFEAICEYYSRTGELEKLLGLLYGKQDNLLNCHYIVFDNTTLTEMLKQIGFMQVCPWDWRKTEHSKYDDYSQAYIPHLDKECGLHMSLNLEATK